MVLSKYETESIERPSTLRLARFPSRAFGIALGCLVLVSSLFAVAPAEGQVGRVGVTVTDPSGEPLADVEIRATQDETGVDMTRTTNDRGKAKLAFKSGVQVHNLVLSKEGFRTLEHQFKPGAGSSYLEFVLEPLSSAPAAGESGEATTAGGAGKLTPAQEVFNEGVEALQNDDFVTAKAKFEEALAIDPELTVSHLALAGVHMEENDAEAAIAAAEKVLATDSENARAVHILYEAQKSLGNDRQAEQALERLTKLESGGNAAAIVYNDGAAALRLGDTERGVERLEKALELDSDLHPAMRLLARVYQAEGEHEKAVDMANRALALEPGEAKLLKLLAESLSALGREAEAEAAMAQLVATDPTTLINDYSKKGEDAFNSGDAQAAVGYFDQIVELDSEHVDAHYFLGLAHVNLGQNAAAKEHFEAFLGLAPEDPRADTAKEMLTFLN